VTSTGTATIFESMFHSFGLKENPFNVSPDPRFLYTGRSYEIALAELMFGIESRRGLLVLTGEAGTGKTTVMRHFLQWLKDKQLSSSYIFHTHLDPAGLLEFILRDFGVLVESTKKSDLLATLHRWLQTQQMVGDSPVIIIDEAQALSLRTLGDLNQLLNLENAQGKLVQMVLAGQPELEEKLRRPELRALRQRIMVRCRLPLLSLEETADYIAVRLRGAGGTGAKTFPQETVETIYSYAGGIPRIVNLLCEHALIGAYADRQTEVSPENVRKAAAEFDMVGAPFAINNFDIDFSPKVRSKPAAKSVPGDNAPAVAETHASHATVAVPQAALASETPAVVESTAACEVPGRVPGEVIREVPLVVEHVIAVDAPAAESLPGIEASAFAEGARAAEAAEDVAARSVSHDNDNVGESVERIQAAKNPNDVPAEGPALATSVQETPASLAMDAKASQLETAPERHVIEVAAVPVAPAPVEIPAVDPVTVTPKEPPPAAAAKAAAASAAGNVQRSSSVAPTISPSEGSSPLLVGPQLVKGTHTSPAARVFAKPKKRKENWSSGSHRGWRKRRTRSPFVVYMREVMESFVSDWRRFISSFSAQIATFPRTSLTGSDSLRRNVIDSVREWLAKPIPQRTTRDARPLTDKSKKP
jgi:general secretion pathway protein A